MYSSFCVYEKNEAEIPMKSWKQLTVLLAISIFMAGCGKKVVESSEFQTPSAADASVFLTATSNLPVGFEEGDYYGLLAIEDIDLHLSTFAADVSGFGGVGAQLITDREDSAAVFLYGGHLVIADHDYQGFTKLLDVIPGTSATITFADGSEDAYECTSTVEGYNWGEIYLQMDTLKGKELSVGISKKMMNLSVIEPYCLVMYTCHGSSSDIYITLWEKKDDSYR